MSWNTVVLAVINTNVCCFCSICLIYHLLVYILAVYCIAYHWGLHYGTACINDDISISFQWWRCRVPSITSSWTIQQSRHSIRLRPLLRDWCSARLKSNWKATVSFASQLIMTLYEMFERNSRFKFCICSYHYCLIPCVPAVMCTAGIVSSNNCLSLSMCLSLCVSAQKLKDYMHWDGEP